MFSFSPFLILYLSLSLFRFVRVVCSKLIQRIFGSWVRWRLEQLHSCAPMFSDTNGFRTSERVTNLIRETTRTDRTCASFCFGLPRLFENFIQNKCVFNKYKSYIIYLYYIFILYYINIYFIILTLFYFI